MGTTNPKVRKAYRDKYRHTIHHHCTERVSQWRRKDSESDLTTEYLEKLYHKQNGKCYYSGVELIIGSIGLSWDSISLDRLTPSLGYKIGNVVWCTYRCNTMKGNLTKDEFIKLLETIVSSDKYRSDHLAMAQVLA